MKPKRKNRPIVRRNLLIFALIVALILITIIMILAAMSPTFAPPYENIITDLQVT